MVKFRFQDLKIWKLAIEIANGLCDVADELEGKKISSANLVAETTNIEANFL